MTDPQGLLCTISFAAGEAWMVTCIAASSLLRGKSAALCTCTLLLFVPTVHLCV